ncbi:hypothetical protein IGI04_026059 [Brassica rapa subsp. trilocularis]|uniref:NmrA-like domain-containing protein n=1 Tax=Brassica rapa subsp. trilocularis TaxID=1813537 RepID=A0ABQ7KUV9_BRACM|nr:hypothetical protein IGI04_026059 [Brassica rapa subsp. trilocularis]
MNEKPSHHPKREIRAQQRHRHLEFVSKSYGCFFGTDIYRSDPRTVNFISILPLIQMETGNGRGIIGNISMPGFQIIYPIVKSAYETVPTSLGVTEKRSTETKSISLEICQGVGAVCVYDQPGDEATLVKQTVFDRILPEYHIDLISESSGVALFEPSRFIRHFLRFLQSRGKVDGLFRKSRTSVEFSPSDLQDSTVDLIV